MVPGCPAGTRVSGGFGGPLLLLAVFGCAPAEIASSEADPVRAWTIAVWMDGDNDLEPAIPGDLDELERSATDGTTIVVQVDRAPGYTSADGDWTGTRRYEIVGSTDHGVGSPPIAELGEVDMGDGAALAEFLLWAHATYPAEHFAVVLWNHGAGFSIASDDTSGSSIDLHDGELTDALQPLVDARGEPIDVVAFDACNMGQWEVAETLIGQARVVTASEAFVSLRGYAYDEVFPALPSDADAADLGDRLAWSAGDFNRELTHAAISIDDVPALTRAIDALAGVYLADPARYTDFRRARAEARGADRQWEEFWLDLGSFADAASASTDPEIAAAASGVREALDVAVIGNYTDPRLGYASGLTILADTSHVSWLRRYGRGRWSDTRWDDLLVAIRGSEGAEGSE